MIGQSASDPGLADVVKECHKMPMEWSLEDEGLFQRMTTRGGLQVQTDLAGSRLPHAQERDQFEDSFD